MLKQSRQAWRWIAAYLATAAILPLLALVREFGIERGRLIAQTYPDLFVFPLCLGGFLPLFVSGPFCRAVMQNQRREVILACWIAFSLAITGIEFFTGPPAIWQISRQQQDSPFSVNPNLTLWKHFETPPGVNQAAAEKAQTKDDEGAQQRTAFQAKLQEVYRISKQTFTSAAYALCVLILALAQLAVLFCSVIFFKRYVRDFAPVKLTASERKAVVRDLFGIFAALVIVAAWFLFNHVKMEQTSKIYPVPNDPIVAFVHGIALVICYVLSLLTMWLHEIRLKALLASAAIGLGVTGLILKQIFDSQFLIEAFGRKANPAGYLFLPMLVLLMVLLLSIEENGAENRRSRDVGRGNG